MRQRRPDRYDYAIGALGAVLSYLILVIAKQEGLSGWQALGLLLAASIPASVALTWLKTRLQARFRKVG